MREGRSSRRRRDPRERVEALRVAFKAMMSDSAVLQEAKSHTIEINQPVPWEEIQALVDRLCACRSPSSGEPTTQPGARSKLASE